MCITICVQQRSNRCALAVFGPSPCVQRDYHTNKPDQYASITATSVSIDLVHHRYVFSSYKLIPPGLNTAVFGLWHVKSESWMYKHFTTGPYHMKVRRFVASHGSPKQKGYYHTLLTSMFSHNGLMHFGCTFRLRCVVYNSLTPLPSQHDHFPLLFSQCRCCHGCSERLEALPWRWRGRFHSRDCLYQEHV